MRIGGRTSVALPTIFTWHITTDTLPSKTVLIGIIQYVAIARYHYQSNYHYLRKTGYTNFSTYGYRNYLCRRSCLCSVFIGNDAFLSIALYINKNYTSLGMESQKDYLNLTYLLELLCDLGKVSQELPNLYR